MKQQFQTQKPKKWFVKIIITVSISVIVILGWVGLTKAGYIPNFLGINMLYPAPIHTNHGQGFDASIVGKPVIYLYPQQKQNTKVELNFHGKLIADYPKYDENIKGWNVTAYPNGQLIDNYDNQKYNYLFWEGKFGKSIDWDLSKGFMIKGEDTREFLQHTLSEIGLTPHEYNEFIVWWYPKMKDNKYNLIHFASHEYTETAPLTITPKPDSMLRVFMVFKPLDKKVDIEPQTIHTFERKGFTVIEWGGTELN